MRSMWSGKLALNALVQVSVSAVKARDSDDSDVHLYEVCECHHEPFKRSTACVVSGDTRLTAEREKAGESGVRMVKAALDGDRYVPIAPETIEQINAAVTSKVIEPLRAISYTEAPMEHVLDEYWLQADKKDAGAAHTLDVIHRALERDGKVLVCMWAARTSERIVLVHPVGNVLVMNTVTFDAELRQPDRAVLEHTAQALGTDAEIEMAAALIDQLDGDADLSGLIDRKVALKQKAVAAAVAGKPMPKGTTTVAAPASPDLAAALAAALGDVRAAPEPKKSKARRAPSKKTAVKA